MLKGAKSTEMHAKNNFKVQALAGDGESHCLTRIALDLGIPRSRIASPQRESELQVFCIARCSAETGVLASQDSIARLWEELVGSKIFSLLV